MAGRSPFPPPPASEPGHPTAAIAAALATLKDVGGIAGSFVFTDEGDLFAREMHPMFDDLTLSETADRLLRLRDTFATVGDQLDLAVIRFQDHRLYLKALDGGMLCIFADGVVNMAALRMAANLVGRRIAQGLQQSRRGFPRASVGGEDGPAPTHRGARRRRRFCAPGVSPPRPTGRDMESGRLEWPYDPDATPPPLPTDAPSTPGTGRKSVAGPPHSVRRFRGRTVE